MFKKESKLKTETKNETKNDVDRLQGCRKKGGRACAHLKFLTPNSAFEYEMFPYTLRVPQSE